MGSITCSHTDLRWSRFGIHASSGPNSGYLSNASGLAPAAVLKPSWHHYPPPKTADGLELNVRWRTVLCRVFCGEAVSEDWKLNHFLLIALNQQRFLSIKYVGCCGVILSPPSGIERARE